MEVSSTLLLLFLGWLRYASSEGSDVFDQSLLKEAIQSSQTLAVMFYAPWCKHSQNLLPVWDELAASMKNDPAAKGVVMAKIDCVKEEAAYWANDIKSFPTVRIFVNSNTLSIDYDGQHDKAVLERYLKVLNRPFVHEVSDEDDIEEFIDARLKKTRPVALATLLETEGSASQTQTLKFDAACKKTDRVLCVVTRNPALASKYGLSDSVSSLAMFTAFGDESGGQVVTSSRSGDLGEISGAEWAKWLLVQSYPILSELTESSAETIFNSRRPGFQSHFIFLVTDATRQESRAVLAAAKRLARELLGRCLFLYVDLARLSTFSAGILQELGLGPQANGERVAAVLSRDTEGEVRFYLGEDASPPQQEHQEQQEQQQQGQPVGLKMDDAGSLRSWALGVLDGKVEASRVVKQESESEMF